LCGSPIVDALEVNYMPYAMTSSSPRHSEIDGFKPSHRKLLYTMYKMGLPAANGRNPNIVGQTMKLNPHATRRSTTQCPHSKATARCSIRGGFQGQLRQGLFPETWSAPPPLY
jgi:hypothetical protein